MEENFLAWDAKQRQEKEGKEAPKDPELCRFTKCKEGATQPGGFCLDHYRQSKCHIAWCCYGRWNGSFFCRIHSDSFKESEATYEEWVEKENEGSHQKCKIEGCNQAAPHPSGVCTRHLGFWEAAKQQILGTTSCDSMAAFQVWCALVGKPKEKPNEISYDIRINHASIDEFQKRIHDLQWDLKDLEEQAERVCQYVANVKEYSMADPKLPSSLPTSKDLQGEAGEAAWRLAGSQIVKLTREPLVALLSRHLGPDDPSMRAKVAAFLSTDIGESLVAAFVSAGLLALPVQAGEVPKRLSRELRVKAMTDAGDVLADVLMGPLREVLSTLLKGETSGEPAALEAKAVEKVEVAVVKQVVGVSGGR